MPTASGGGVVSRSATSGEMASDDDGGGGTSARVDLVPTETGTWEVWANSLTAGATGAYRLTIELSR